MIILIVLLATRILGMIIWPIVYPLLSVLLGRDFLNLLFSFLV